MTKRICKECSSNDWEEIIHNFVHDEPNITLFQCKKCKRIVAFDPDESVYEHKNFTVLETVKI
jgi:hypothetical protein